MVDLVTLEQVNLALKLDLTQSGSPAAFTDARTPDVELKITQAQDATVTFWPEMWLEPSDNDVIEMIDPYLEGLLVDEGDQTSGRFAAVSTAPFVIEEG
ncbi:hypothetical protein [Brevundimonas sp. Root1423]|uniref:hypothetical protein n=1 Tax=Brevundimonas sp. Root1423 TaxID=1736462 RepID=UPI0006FD8FA9|nr:hypothetical protein [Brevundimonas sp. Root1423]KQY96406.1 hypothetical protein ASD25_00510 [Brevundimonas sp. Root1423]